MTSADGMHSPSGPTRGHSLGYSEKDVEALDAAAKALAGEPGDHDGDNDERSAVENGTLPEARHEKPNPDDTGSPSPSSSAPENSPSDTTDDDALTYPEGGTQAWLTVLGAWCGMTAGIGLLNTVASLQSYLSTHQLSRYPLSSIGWIFSIQALLVFFCGIQIGPLFDAIGPRKLVATGSVLLVVSMMVLGECEEYWHFILAFSIVNGLGGSLLLTPPLASIGHFFHRRRAFATGIAMSGPSMGGVIFPLVFRAVYPRAGFAWACRALGFIIAFLLVFANLFIRSRLPRRKVTVKEIMPDFRILLDGDGALALRILGLCLMELGLFIPLAYLTSYCIANGMEEGFSYNILAILNAASVFGRALPGLVADKLGRYNTNAVLLMLSAMTALVIWLPLTLARPTGSAFTGGAIVFAIAFGFASGSNLSLTGPCIGQLCDTRHYGRYFSTCYVFISFAALIGIPIAGNILDANGGDYWGLIVFTGMSYVGSAVCMAAVRVTRVGWRVKAVF